MPIPPILDVFVIWHPDDIHGPERFAELQDYFHGPAFSGLVGGAVEVYARSTPWTDNGAPRPLGIDRPLVDGLPKAQFNVIVPVLSKEMAAAATSEPWASYLGELVALRELPGAAVYCVPHPAVNLETGALSQVFGSSQTLPMAARDDPLLFSRELAQAITQGIRREEGKTDRIVVFVSHVKHRSLAEDDDMPAVYESVRQRIADSHLAEFFDAHDIQTGAPWVEILESSAREHALLIVRTDRYAEREWTQREVKAAKEAEVPVVTMYALASGEERGSFLMDHVPTVVCDLEDRTPGIDAALSALVSEALKSTLWESQRSYLASDGFDWLPTRSPEPTTLLPWLAAHQKESPEDGEIWIMHPDPPLGSAEREVLIQLCEVAGYSSNVNILTPRTFAVRGGDVK